MEQDPVNPPPAPEIQRRISFYPAHLVGLILLALVPLLALFGVFGEVQANDSARSASFLLQVEYPAQSRHRIFETTTITVTNTSNQPYDAVTVKISEDYIGAFAEVAFDTEVEQITPMLTNSS